MQNQKVIYSWCQRLLRKQEGEGVTDSLCERCLPQVASGVAAKDIDHVLAVGDQIRYCGQSFEVIGIERSINGMADGGKALDSIHWSEVDDRLILDLPNNRWLAGDQVERIPFKEGVQR